MGKIMYKDIPFIGAVKTDHIELTQLQYDALSAAEKSDPDKIYFIRDGIPTPNNLADYVIEEGTDGIWQYRKWNSGIAECWGRGSATLSHYTTSGGNGFYGYHTTFSLPTGLFVAGSVPVHTYIPTVGTGFAMPASGMSSSNTGIHVYALSSTSGSQSCVFDMMVKGRWK